MILLESPWPWILLGIAAEAALAVALVRTQRGHLIWAMLGVAVVMLLGLAVERLVVTEREAVEMTLDAGVAAARANDVNRLLACISPRATRTREYARLIMGRAQVEDARILHLEITINHATSPPTARARFQAFGQGRDRMNELPYRTFAKWVVVELRREGDRWLVGDFEVEDFERPRR
jgi:hypothetical protein